MNVDTSNQVDQILDSVGLSIISMLSKAGNGKIKLVQADKEILITYWYDSDRLSVLIAGYSSAVSDSVSPDSFALWCLDLIPMSLAYEGNLDVVVSKNADIRIIVTRY